MNSLDLLREEFQRHVDKDNEFHETILARLDLLATKEDVKGVTQAFNTIKANGSFVLWVGALILAVMTIAGGWRSAIAFLLPNK